jgi:signal transduction histidine kinase/DNA-binding NarL/FixJ family response regulator
MKWIKTLKFRLIVTMMGLVLLTILIISVSIVSNQRQAIEKQARQDSAALAELLVTNTLTAVLFDDASSARQSLEALRVRRDISQVMIFDDKARLFASYQNRAKQSPPDIDSLRRVLRTRDPIITENERGLHLMMPMISHGEVIGVLYLLDNLAALRSQLSAFYRVVAMTAVLAFFASLVAMLWLVSLFTKPLNEMLATIRDITIHRDYKRRAPKAGTVEFNQLADSFNQMISEIERRGQQLETMNAELEQRVQARTEALETALELANEANHAKAQFLAMMSHEVRTPLNGVIGFAELLKLNDLEDEARENVQLLNDSAQALLALLNQILDFSKLDADKVELEKQQMNMASFMKSVVETNRAKAERKGLKLALSLQDCDAAFLGDPLRLRQVLNNLIDNAIKFTNKGSVKVSLIAEHTETESWLNFEIEDTGTGIAESKLQSIFSPFAQADNTVTRQYGGTGLGLAICAQLIKLMKGHYGVRSEEKQGSLFWFRIPMQRLDVAESVKPPQKKPARQTKASGNLILLAEDNEINQSVAAGMLENFGYQVVIVSNGLEAVNECNKTRYDLILMDYHMPQMGGLEATALIRNQSGQGLNSETPIVALTADIQDGVEADFRHAGADDFLVKPFSLEQLSDIIGRWLDSTEKDTRNVPVIDETVLDEIRRMSGEQAPALINNIVEIYLQQTPNLIDDIQYGARNGDADRVFRAAHALKSSSANIGAVRVSEIAHQVEKLGRHNRIEHVHSHLNTLLESYEQARLDLKSRLGEI